MWRKAKKKKIKIVVDFSINIGNTGRKFCDNFKKIF